MVRQMPPPPSTSNMDFGMNNLAVSNVRRSLAEAASLNRSNNESYYSYTGNAPVAPSNSSFQPPYTAASTSSMQPPTTTSFDAPTSTSYQHSASASSFQPTTSASFHAPTNGSFQPLTSASIPAHANNSTSSFQSASVLHLTNRTNAVSVLANGMTMLLVVFHPSYHYHISSSLLSSS